jgi:aspartate racemase
MAAAPRMKIPGIVGGIAPESTVDYYRRILAAYREHVPDGSAPAMLINSIDLKRMLGLIGAGEIAAVTEYLLEEIRRLARAGADFGLLASNTPHLVFDDLSERSPIPLVSIVEAARDAALAQGITRAGLFGTRFTMEARFYPDVFARAGIAVIAPAEDERAYIHERYMSELVNAQFLGETRSRLLAIAERMRRDEGAEAIILGGTELPLLLRDAEIGSLRFLDTTQIHVERIVERILA